MDNQFINLALFIGMMLLMILAKVLTFKIVDGKNTKEQFLSGIGLFLVYAVAMGGALWAVGRSAVTAAECRQRMLLTFLLGDIIMLFILGLCYGLLRKRDLSEMDKMKLKDL